MNCIRVLSIAALLFVSSALAVAAQGPNQPLHMVIMRDRAGSREHPLFRVELQNAGDQPLVLNLGTMGANGRKQHPTAIHLLLKEPGGKALPVELMVGGVAEGRVDPLVVPLPKGATFSLLVDLADYGAPGRNLWKVDLPPGSYGIQAEYEGKNVSMKDTSTDLQGMALMPYWIGEIQSGVLNFVIPRPVGKREK